MLGDCCGPGSAFEQTRQHLSSYVWDHYADLDPKETNSEPRPGSMVRHLEIALAVASGVSPAVETGVVPGGEGAPGERDATSSLNPDGSLSTKLRRTLDPPRIRGLVLEAGCSVGRGAFALAERTDGLVLGVDLNFAMLRQASEVLRLGTVRYPRRRVGLVYERREFQAHFANREKVDFWACDASTLPFPHERFSLAVNLNLLDCVISPREFLVSLGSVLKLRGKAVLACPYDWSIAATPLEAWLGGHSQRSPMGGSPEAVLRALLTPGAHPSSVNTLKLTAERENLTWHVRLHDRSAMAYKVHLIVAERV